ncbi:MAG: hypothetical protein A2162_03745, partial [Deltaproteobacteria bacterium RBG_13_52_11b]
MKKRILALCAILLIVLLTASVASAHGRFRGGFHHPPSGFSITIGPPIFWGPPAYYPYYYPPPEYPPPPVYYPPPPPPESSPPPAPPGSEASWVPGHYEERWTAYGW